MRTFHLSPAEYAETVAKIAKVNERAAKKGFTGRFDVEGVEKVRIERVSGFEVKHPYYEVTITGEAPCYEGWTLLAALDFDPNAGLITRNAPGTEGINVDRAAIRENACDHCGTERYRRHSFVVVNVETGEQKQVGSTCLADFLGLDGSPVFMSVEDIEGDMDGWGFGFGGGPSQVDTLDLLAIAWAAIKTYGYVRSGSFDGVSTKQTVSDFLWGRGKAAEQIREEIGANVEGSMEAAAKTRAFILSDDFAGDSDYVINLKAIIGAEYVSPNNIGFAVSAPQALARHEERTLIRQREQAEVAESNFVGTVKERLTLDVTLKTVRYIEGYYGTTTLYVLVDEQGNQFKWFASNDVLGDIANVGKAFNITGTVKGHEEFRGVKETVLTRVKDNGAPVRKCAVCGKKETASRMLIKRTNTENVDRLVHFDCEA